MLALPPARVDSSLCVSVRHPHARQIERYTEETCPNKNVSSDPIRLKIVSPDVLTMTLVDLPGLTKNPVGGQSETIVQDIKAPHPGMTPLVRCENRRGGSPHLADPRPPLQEVVEGFIKNPNCIILAVSPAIDDIANSEVPRPNPRTSPKPLFSGRHSQSPAGTTRRAFVRWVC